MMTRRGLAALSVLAVPGIAAAAPYRPGTGLEIGRFDRPGDGSVNSYLLIGARSVVIVDAQRTGVEARSVIAAARGLNLPVEAIILTHEHPDHVAGLGALTAAFPGVPVMAGEGTRDWIARNGAELIAGMKRNFGAAMPDAIPVPSRILRPGETLHLADVEWRVDQLGPCEASGMTLLHAEAEDVLIAADLFGNAVTPFLLDGHVLPWIAELERALPRYGHVSTALPGHGAAAPAGALIAAQRDYLLSFVALVRAANGAGAPEDRARIGRAMEALYPGRPLVAPIPALLEANAEALGKELGRR